jgi:hypothetical protein
MTLKQIAEVMGKTEASIQRLFVGVNEIANNNELQSVIGCAGATIAEFVDTRGIPDKEARLNLLEQRGNGEITRSEMRDRTKALKKGASTGTPSDTETGLVGKPSNEAQPAEPDPAVKMSVSDDGLVISLFCNNRASAQVMEGEIRRLLAGRGIQEEKDDRIFAKKR